jgi:IS30 family transposase
LATNLRLRGEVQSRLQHNHSPEQISKRLREDFPDDPELQVSHEAIYQSLYIQGRGALRRELTQHLRTGRSLRKPQRQATTRRSRRGGTQIKDMINIAERPPEAADRAVPGHWEGDLITGAENRTAIGTLVERTTGFLILLHLPDNHSALAVQEAVTTAITALPEMLRKTLTWDQGSEMTNHAKIAEATGLEIYFCDPHSPWQRGTNENTNGLLRQYFPKGSDLSFHGAGILERVAIEINNRPRKRLEWRTPAEALDRLLSEHENTHGVADAG